MSASDDDDDHDLAQRSTEKSDSEASSDSSENGGEVDGSLVIDNCEEEDNSSGDDLSESEQNSTTLRHVISRTPEKSIDGSDSDNSTDTDVHRTTTSSNQQYQKSDAEKHLEELVFGGADNFIEDLNENSQDDWYTGTPCERSKAASKRNPAWKDDDDDGASLMPSSKIAKQVSPTSTSVTKSYSEELRARFVSVVGTPQWADLDARDKNKDSDDEREELLTKVGNFIVKTSALPRTIIDVKRCKSISESSHLMGLVTNAEFHPQAQIAMVAGLNNKVGLYQVDGIKNSLIQNVTFDKFPVNCAQFTMSGNEFIASSSKHQHFYAYNMITGKPLKLFWNKHLEGRFMRNIYLSPDGKLMVVSGQNGYIHLFSAATKEWLHCFKMNSNVEGIAFNVDGSRMFSHSAAGEVYVWNMNTRDCIHKFHDDGCLNGTSIAVSPNQQFLACGSSSGVVNIYDTSKLLESQTPRPLKVVLNLTTSVTRMKFNSTSEILAFSSPSKYAAIKMVHFPSMSVFSNFPTPESKLGAITSLDISVNSGFMMTGTKKGETHLFRLMHFENF